MSPQKIALVTGANRGLGRSIACALAARRMKVVLTYREGKEAADRVVSAIAATGGEALALRLDIRDVESFQSFREQLTEAVTRQWGAAELHVLVNNAGIGVFGALDEVTVADFDAVVETNFKGTYFLIQFLAPMMVGGGRIINVSSSLTRHSSPATSVYAASKTAVEAISRSLALELGPRGIRINVVAPGPSATDFNGGAMRDNEGLREVLSAQTALGRVGEPEEIGDAIAALASDEMRWITAERIEVSGGVLL